MDAEFKEALERYKTKPYFRLCGCKIPSVNLYGPYYKKMCDTLEKNEIGEFMNALYGFIYEGKLFEWKVKRAQTLWEDILNNMNKTAESWFKKKETEEMNKFIKDIMLD